MLSVSRVSSFCLRSSTGRLQPSRFSPRSSLTFSRRQCATQTTASTTASPANVPSLAMVLGTGYVTLLGANVISNIMIHPLEKLDYGILNSFCPDNREVGIHTQA